MVESGRATRGTHRELRDGKDGRHPGERPDGVERRPPRTAPGQLVGEARGEARGVAEARLASGLACDVIAELVKDPSALRPRDAGGGQAVAELLEPRHPSTASTA
jgi:hypothetical protein